jgi:hypothetical protein
MEREYRKYRAILILTNTLDRKDREQSDHDLSIFTKLPSTIIRGTYSNLKTELKRLTDKYGVIGSLDVLEGILKAERIKKIGPNAYLCISKYRLSQLFTKYHKAFPHFIKLPPHARVGIDVQSLRDNIAKVETFQLEVSLFEDMAALWNEAFKAYSKYDQSTKTKVLFKHAGASMRATAKAAFNLIEGYLNGLACDILLLKSVSPDEYALLEEWDSAQKRLKFLTLRDKILQYPKIAIGASHPPLQESSCPEIDRIIRLERDLRQALIHPRPQVNSTDPTSFREATYFELKLPTVAALVDDVIELIFKISEIVGDEYGDVRDWLSRRQKNKLFDDAIFF